nr:TCP-1/cpn60 chaperonin family protein [Haloquadratum walsbyi]
MSDNAVQQPQLPTAADVDGYLNNDPHITNFYAVMALSNSIKTTLGPKGLDKLLITGDNKIVATNDGASIIDRMDIDHPAAKMTTSIVEEQRTRAGDGTTTAIVLIGALLNSAVDLINRGVHPSDIIRGNRFATERAVDILSNQAVDVSVDRKQLETIAQTAINGKWDSDGREFIADKAVETVLSVEQDGAVDFSAITRKGVKGGSYYDSEVIDGLLIDTDSSSTDSVSPTINIQSELENVSVALIDNGLTIDTASDQGTVTFDSPARRNELHEYEDQKYIQHANRIIESGANIVFCQQSIDDPP